jgi:radical SAM family RiPP maturation amino acid epimerase
LHAAKIAHPIFAFELSNGCSVGCNFCGVGAEKLRSNFRRTPENARLWRSVLEAACSRFGPAMRTAFCYWATEPMDNLDYIELVDDFHQVTGELPQTTTIAPLRNVERTKRLLELHRRHEAIQNRFSIQSLEMLREVHAAFTPEELANVRLLLYHQNNQLKRTKAGKAYVTGSEHEEAWDGGTIACVSGFLVNMCTKTIRLISPCPASEEWRNGYRVYYSGRFETAAELDACVAEAAELCMPEAPSDDEVVAFRADLTLREIEDGIALKSRYRETLFTGKPFLGEMGSMIAESRHRASEINGRLIEGGADFLDVFATMHSLFEGGFLDESRTICRGARVG